MLDKIKGWNNYYAIKTAQVLSLVLMPIAVVVLVINFSWLYLFVALLSVLLISKVGHSIGQHRYFSHKSFKTDSKREWLMAFFGTLGTTHTAVHYAALHRYHHANSDTELDPHCPNKLGVIRSFFGFIDRTKADKIPFRIVKDLLSNKPVMFFYNWYWPTLVFYWILLIAMDPLLFVFCYIIPCGYVQFVAGVQLSLGHHKGYVNFDTRDKSINSLIWNVLTFGEGLHNNHHNKPYEYNFAYTSKPGEWDFCGWFVEKFLKV